MRFSIITPSLNNGCWLKLCIASVADQAGVDLEHIIQDGGSTDDTPDILKSEPRVRPFIEKDDGMYDAINRGFRRATGDILAYLNCDEQYLPGALSRVQEFFDKNPHIDVLFGDAILVDVHGAPLSYRRMILPFRPHVRIVHLNTLTCATFFRRSVLDRGYFFKSNWKVIGDAVWVDDLLRERIPMATLQHPLAAFTFTGSNLAASERGTKEMKALRGASWKTALVPLLALHNRFRKWRAGAYRPHSVEYRIFTLESPHSRKGFSQCDLSFGWPHHLARQQGRPTE